MNKYEIVEIDNKEVEVDISLIIKSEALYFNATKIANQFNKRADTYLKNDRAREYIEMLNKKLNVPNETFKKLSFSKQGKYGGTWMHKDLAIDFARWCSPEFAYEMDKWIINKLNEEKNRKNGRLETKTGYLPLTEAVERAYENRSDIAKKFSYSNEADLLNILVIGMKAKKYKELYKVDNPRDNFTVAELDLIERLQRANTIYLDEGLTFEERKEKLIFLSNKYKLQY